MVTENDDDDGVMGRDTLEEQRRLRLLPVRAESPLHIYYQAHAFPSESPSDATSNPSKTSTPADPLHTKFTKRHYH